jgi:hypothetical protein
MLPSAAQAAAAVSVSVPAEAETTEDTHHYFLESLKTLLIVGNQSRVRG